MPELMRGISLIKASRSLGSPAPFGEVEKPVILLFLGPHECLRKAERKFLAAAVSDSTDPISQVLTRFVSLFSAE